MSDDVFYRISTIMNVDQTEIAKIVHDYIERDIGCDYDRFNSPPPPIYIGPVKVKTLKERLEECKMNATSVQVINNVKDMNVTIEKSPLEETKIIINVSTDDDNYEFNCSGFGCENFLRKMAAERRFKEKLHDFEFNNKKYDGKIMAEILKRNSGRYPWGEEKSPADNVNHPSHYETGRFECIEVMEEVFGVEAVKNFCLCNAFKYIWRLKRKNGVEDAKKAVWYLNKYIEHEDLVKVDDIPEVSCDNCKYKWYEQRQEPCKDCNNGNKFVKREE